MTNYWSLLSIDEYDSTKKDYEEELAKHKATHDRLVNMLNKVISYIPPSEDHENFKNFMVEQLESTLKHDGSYSYYEKELAKLKLQSAEELKEKTIARLQDDIKYHSEGYAKEVEGVNGRNLWIKQLRDSLRNVE